MHYVDDEPLQNKIFRPFRPEVYTLRIGRRPGKFSKRGGYVCRPLVFSS